MCRCITSDSLLQSKTIPIFQYWQWEHQNTWGICCNVILSPHKHETEKVWTDSPNLLLRRQKHHRLFFVIWRHRLLMQRHRSGFYAENPWHFMKWKIFSEKGYYSVWSVKFSVTHFHFFGGITLCFDAPFAIRKEFSMYSHWRNRPNSKLPSILDSWKDLPTLDLSLKEKMFAILWKIVVSTESVWFLMKMIREIRYIYSFPWSDNRHNCFKGRIKHQLLWLFDFPIPFQSQTTISSLERWT